MTSTTIPPTATSGGPPESTIDPADEAGGEVVYSSDGLLPLEIKTPPPATPKPKKTKKMTTPSKTDREEVEDDDEDDDGGEDYVLDSATMEASDAFEIFSGKVFSKPTTQSSSSRKTSTAYAEPVAKETPLQRLARLQREVAEVEAELNTTITASSVGDAPADAATDAKCETVEGALLQLANQLKSRLTTLSTTRLPEQDELTRLIDQQLKEVQGGGKRSTAPEAATPATTPETPSGTGVVYELYGTSQSNNPSTTTMGERLTTVERLVGGNNNGSNSTSSSTSSSHKSLLSRLEELEIVAKGMDATSLEQAATKAKVIRADLEAASKARNKLNSSSSSSSATFGKREDSKMIQQLHQQMIELDGLSSHLPALTQRLQQLATLHVQSASFATRLSQAERQASHVQASLIQLEQVFDKVQADMVANCQMVEQNVKQLDERLKEF